MKTFKKGGIHPNPSKITAGGKVSEAGIPAMLTINLAQSIGAPARCVVKPLQHVEAGELIAEAGGFVSANIHTPVSGTVKKIEPVRDPQGIWRPGVIIEADPDLPESGSTILSDAEIDSLTPKQIVEKIAAAGIVGMGGATFPTAVKLSIPEGKSIDTVILNGAECEPYLTCDDTLMRNKASEIAEGLRLIMKATGASKGIIGIEHNKPEAITAMKEAVAGLHDISVEALRTKYPQGGEKQLIYALTRRTVPAGGLPLDVHVVVDNVATAYSITQAVRRGTPLTSRLVTVTGPELRDPGDFLVHIGTPISELIQMAGGDPDKAGKIIAGGPMMGRAVSHPDAPSTKGLSGVLVLPADMAERKESESCIRCGRCVDVCPMGLQPNLLMNLGLHGLYEETRIHGALNCLECGSCSYICLAHRPILDYIRLSRQNLRKKK